MQSFIVIKIVTSTNLDRTYLRQQQFHLKKSTKRSKIILYNIFYTLKKEKGLQERAHKNLFPLSFQKRNLFQF